jgi:hypothetical protein
MYFLPCLIASDQQSDRIIDNDSANNRLTSHHSIAQHSTAQHKRGCFPPFPLCCTCVHSRIHASPPQYRSLHERPTLCVILRPRPHRAATCPAVAGGLEALGLRHFRFRAVEGRVAKSLSAGGRDPRINGSNVGAISSAGQQETGNACGEM